MLIFMPTILLFDPPRLMAVLLLSSVQSPPFMPTILLFNSPLHAPAIQFAPLQSEPPSVQLPFPLLFMLTFRLTIPLFFNCSLGPFMLTVLLFNSPLYADHTVVQCPPPSLQAERRTVQTPLPHPVILSLRLVVLLFFNRSIPRFRTDHPTPPSPLQAGRLLQANHPSVHSPPFEGDRPAVQFRLFMPTFLLFNALLHDDHPGALTH